MTPKFWEEDVGDVLPLKLHLHASEIKILIHKVFSIL